MKRTMLLLSISVLATLILGWVNFAEAQQAGKMHRIGYLSFSCGPVFTKRKALNPPLPISVATRSRWLTGPGTHQANILLWTAGAM